MGARNDLGRGGYQLVVWFPHRVRDGSVSESNTLGEFNALFEWLQLAAVIEDKVCCMHGGIGPSIETLEQIDQLERPCSGIGGLELMDLLWSDSTENDSVEGLRPNARGPA